MIRTLSTIALCVCTVIPAALLAACGETSAPPRPGQVATGAVSMPLTTTVNSHTYRLDATVYLFGTNGLTVLSSSGDPAETELRATVPTGTYSAQLQWWTLLREDAKGNFQSVQATLLSSSNVNVDVQNGTTSTVAYQFQTDGVIVTIGSGDVRVTVDVNEIPPVCTPFGSDCADGTWCAPTGLTGAPLACIPAGAVALGDPCHDPSDCGASASCIDSGSGPVCTEVCPSSAFDQPCSSGGTCTQAADDYGVCK